MHETSNYKAEQSRQLQHTEDSELSAVDLLFSLNAYLKQDAYHSQGSRVFLRELQAICTDVPLDASKQVKRKQSTHAAMITELDLLTRFATVWRRLLEKEGSEESLLSWRGVPPDPSKLVRMRTLRGVRGVCATVPPKLPGVCATGPPKMPGVCATVPPKLPGKVAGATGKSST